MSTFLGFPEAGSLPSTIANHPLTKASGLVKGGDVIENYFAPITKRLHEIASEQSIPITDNTRASLISDVNTYLSDVTRMHLATYEGWTADIFPLKEASELFMRMRIWTNVPMTMQDAPEGVVPPIIMHKFEDLWFGLRRYNIGTKAHHGSLLTAEGLKNWILKQSLQIDALNATFEMAAVRAVEAHPSSFTRQMYAQGQRPYTNVAEALSWEVETYLLGLVSNGLGKLAMMINEQQKSSAPDAPLFNRFVLPSGSRQREAFSNYQSDPVKRGPQAIKNNEGGGLAWESKGIPGFLLYEADRLNYVNLGSQYAPFERLSRISTYFVVDGREGLNFSIDEYDPEAELRVMVRDINTAPALNSFNYSDCLDGSHRFDVDGYLDREAHREMIMMLPQLANAQGFHLNRLQDLDPFVWHNPNDPVDPSGTGFHICDIYGDVPEKFRSHHVDDKHGEAFSRLLIKNIGHEGQTKLDALRELVDRLDHPPMSLWTAVDDATPVIQVWLAAIAASDNIIIEGAYDVPLNPPEGLNLPYGYTTISCIQALARKHHSDPGTWSEEAKAAFQVANEAMQVLKRIWTLIRRVYPECILVKTEQFVPSWMATDRKDKNAFYSVMANFFDTRVRYPVWLITGSSSNRIIAGDLENLGLTSSDERLAAFNKGVLSSTVAAWVRDSDNASKLAAAYKDHISKWYKRIISEDDPRAGDGLEDFFVHEVDPLGADEGAGVVAGIMSFAHEFSFSGSRARRTLSRALIDSWKLTRARRLADEGEEGVEPDAIGVTNAVNTRLSFNPSVWQNLAARNLDSVAPADPTQPDRPLPTNEKGLSFARGRYDEDYDDSPMQIDNLGSLDELDEEQILYPFIYKKETDIFWKFDQGRTTHVQTYYLWHRVHHLRVREPDQFARLGVFCMLFSKISKQADLACTAPGVAIPPPDLCFMGVRPAIQQRTQGVLIARGGGEAGTMWWKHIDNKVGLDPLTKMWTSNFDAWLGAGVTDPRLITFHRDIYPSGGLTGYDTKVVSRNFSMTKRGSEKSLLVFYTGSEFTRTKALETANPFPLSGRFDRDYFGDTSFSSDAEAAMNDNVNPPFPGFWYYAMLFSLQNMNGQNRWAADTAHEELSHTRYISGIVFMEEHRSYGGNKRFDKKHGGTGHTRTWPDNIRDISDGTHVFFSTELKRSD